MKALALSLLLTAAAPEAPAKAPPPAPSPTLELMVAICKLPPADAQRAIAALPDNARPAAMLVCIGYERGHLDLLHALQGEPATRRAI